VVAIHHHMFGTQPQIIFLHYWGIGSAAKLAEGLKLGDKEKEELRRQADRTAESMHAQAIATKQATHEQAIQNARTAQDNLVSRRNATAENTQAIETEQREVAGSIRAAKAAKVARATAHQQEIQDLQARIQAAAEPEKTRLNTELANKQQLCSVDNERNDAIVAHGESEEQRLRQRIATEVAGPNAEAEAEVTRAQSAVRTAESALRQERNTVKETARAVNKTFTASTNETNQDVAEHIGRSESNFWQADDVAEAARSSLKKKDGDASRLSDIMRNISREEGGAPNGNAGTPPADH